MRVERLVPPWSDCPPEEKLERVARARAARFGPPAAKVPFRRSVKLTGVKAKKKKAE